MSTNSSFFNQAFSRNIGLISINEQRLLGRSKVAIAGMGGVGGIELINLTRSGIGSFSLADFDTFEIENTNRQYGSNTSNCGKSKLAVMSAAAVDINPELKIHRFETGISNDNIDDFLSEVSVVIDGLDAFAIDERLLLFKKAREKGIPVVTAGPIGFGVSMLVVTKESSSLEEYLDIRDGMCKEARLAAFFAGLTPDSSYLKYMDLNYVSMPHRRGPSFGAACGLCAGFATIEAVKLILKRGKVYTVPYSLRVDAFSNKTKRTYLPFGNRGPVQKLRRFIITNLLKSSSKRPPPMPSLPQVHFKGGAPTTEAVKIMLSAGSLAISGDNSQHWKFNWDGRKLVISGDKERGKFFYTIKGDAPFISYGSVIENISIAASSMSLKPSITYSSLEDLHGEIATLEFQESRAACDPLYPYIYERSTNRGAYSKQAISTENINAILSEVSSDSKAKITFFAGSQKIKLERLIFKAESLIWENQAYHNDLFRWLRFNENHADGLTPSTLGIAKHELLILRQLRHWGLVNFLSNFGLSRILSKAAYKWGKDCGAFALVQYDIKSNVDYINAGRLITRVWTKANSIGVSIQPMSLLLNLYNRMTLINGEGLSEKNKVKAENLVNAFADLIDKNYMGLMLFRLGYPKNSTALSNRRVIELI